MAADCQAATLVSTAGKKQASGAELAAQEMALATTATSVDGDSAGMEIDASGLEESSEMDSPTQAAAEEAEGAALLGTADFGGTFSPLALQRKDDETEGLVREYLSLAEEAAVDGEGIDSFEHSSAIPATAAVLPPAPAPSMAATNMTTDSLALSEDVVDPATAAAYAEADAAWVASLKAGSAEPAGTQRLLGTTLLLDPADAPAAAAEAQTAEGDMVKQSEQAPAEAAEEPAETATAQAEVALAARPAPAAGPGGLARAASDEEVDALIEEVASRGSAAEEAAADAADEAADKEPQAVDGLLAQIDATLGNDLRDLDQGQFDALLSGMRGFVEHPEHGSGSASSAGSSKKQTARDYETKDEVKRKEEAKEEAKVEPKLPKATEATTASAERTLAPDDELDSLQLQPADGVWSAWTANSNTRSPAQPMSKYRDKGEGLTVQQRLAQMEFSDDEDEDGDGPSRTATVQRPTEEHAEACEPVAESLVCPPDSPCGAAEIQVP